MPEKIHVGAWVEDQKGGMRVVAKVEEEEFLRVLSQALLNAGGDLAKAWREIRLEIQRQVLRL